LAPPVSSYGLKLADESVRVAVGHALAVASVLPTQTISDVIARAVTSAGIPVTNEHVGLTRLDGK